MRIDFVTVFPDYFAPLQLSLVGKAIAAGLVEMAIHDLRRWTHDVHRTVDDTPFGGGAGMVMRPEPWGEALDELLGAAPAADGRAVFVVPSPSGVPFTQAMARDWSEADRLLFACGRYEGIDARVPLYAASRVETVEASLGDYVLNGGEVAALAMVEAVVRLIPGVVGNPASLVEESYSPGCEDVLEYPVYTKPASWRGLDVPQVLLSGHHAKIAAWRREQALALTRRRRPDLLPPAAG
ncbi:MAG: tRNA (guanosine(37)-N1)-methyltransferase TrmD [Propionibacteriaceae bacterium]|jgi:tRNA (guanine37-N1)-methyltransferase|nr:tRNA (guanosine(37)-N1)-methyltransferase TrmD [Propionibacteriaceae bacterium]